MMTEPEVRDLRKRLIESAQADRKNGFTKDLPQAIAGANALSIVLGDEPTAQTEVYGA